MDEFGETGFFTDKNGVNSKTLPQKKVKGGGKSTLDSTKVTSLRTQGIVRGRARFPANFFYCQEYDKARKLGQKVTYVSIAQKLAPDWKKFTDDEKAPYIKMF